MIDSESKETLEDTNITEDELLKLKKELADEVVDKLLEKKPELDSSLSKWSISNYLVNENTLKDIFHDEILVWTLWKLIWLTISPDIKKYRDMLNKANTKNDLENLKTTIFNEIWWTSQTLTEHAEASDAYASSESDNKSLDSNKKYSGEKVQDWIDTEKKTYRNSKSWLTYNLYDQALWPRWNLKYKDRNTTVASIWCMLTSAACITSAVEPSKTPKDFFESYPHTHVFESIPKMTNKRKAKQIIKGDKQKQIEENLEKGYPAIFMVRWHKRGGKNKYTTSQHYMAAIDIRDVWGKKEIFIANTHNNKWGGRVPADEVFISMQEASIYTPSKA